MIAGSYNSSVSNDSCDVWVAFKEIRFDGALQQYLWREHFLRIQGQLGLTNKWNVCKESNYFQTSAENPIIFKTFQKQDWFSKKYKKVNFQLFPEKRKTSYVHMAKDEVHDICEVWVNEVTSDLGFRWEEWSVVSSWVTWWSTSRWMIHQCSVPGAWLPPRMLGGSLDDWDDGYLGGLSN